MNSSFRRLSLFLLMVASTSVLPASTLPTRVPIAGEWNPAKPGVEIGFYNTVTSSFVLCTERASVGQLPCTSFSVPNIKAGRMPLIGRWSRLSAGDRPALYDPDTGQLLLFRYLSCQPHECSQAGHLEFDQIYSLGVVGAIAATSGDWNGDGIDTLALVVPDPKQQQWGEPLIGQVLFYAADHLSVDSILPLDFDPTPYQLIVGRWPGTSSATDSLGFYEPTDRFVLLETETSEFRLFPIATPHSGLQMFGAAWGSQGDSIGLYTPYRSNCAPAACHRVDFFTVQPEDGLGSTSSVVPGEDPHPHLDAIFPDDPGDPNP